MPELPFTWYETGVHDVLFLKQVCLNYCLRAYLAYLLPGTRQARFQAFNPFWTPVPFWGQIIWN